MTQIIIWPQVTVDMSTGSVLAGNEREHQRASQRGCEESSFIPPENSRGVSTHWG